LVYGGGVLPDWFDLHALRLTVSIAAVVCALLAVLALARLRHPALRAGFAVVLLAATGALGVWYQGPLKHADETCSYRFMKSDLAVDGCIAPNGTAQGAHR
jgi:hypothetical protein